MNYHADEICGWNYIQYDCSITTLCLYRRKLRADNVRYGCDRINAVAAAALNIAADI